MKRIFVSLVCAVVLVLFHAGMRTGVMAFDLLLPLLLLLTLAYRAQFPFSLPAFSAQNGGEKTFIAVAVSFGNMIALFVVPGLIAYGFRLTLLQLMALYLAVMLGVTYFNAGASLKFVKEKTAAKPAQNEVLNLLFWIIVIAGLGFALYYGSWISGDYTWHGTYIRKLREVSPIAYRNYLVGDLPYPQYGHNIWHLFVAFFSFVCGLDVGHVWVNTGVYMQAVRIALYYLLARALFKNNYWAQVATVISVIITCFLGIDMGGDTPLVENRWSWDTLVFPAGVSRDLFVTLFLYYVVRGINEKKVYVKEAVAASVCVALTHFYYVYQLAFVLVSAYLVALLARSEETDLYRSQMKSYGLALLPALIYAFGYKQLLDTPTINPTFLSALGTGDLHKRVHFLWDKYPYVHIWEGFFRNYFFAFTTAAFIPLLISLRKGARTVSKLYLAVPPLFLLLMLENPFLMFYLQKMNPGLDRFWRFIEIINPPLIFTGFLVLLQDELKWIKRGAVTGFLFLLLIVAMPFMMRYNKVIPYSAGMWNRTIDQHVAYSGIMRRYVPAGSMVSVDPAMAWTWTTIFPHYLYIHPYAGGLPPNFDPVHRQELWKAFFEKDMTGEEITDLKAKKVDYVIMNMATFQRKAEDFRKNGEYFETPVVINEIGLVVAKLKR